jgi:hypothetical protein
MGIELLINSTLHPTGEKPPRQPLNLKARLWDPLSPARGWKALKQASVTPNVDMKA